MSPLVTTTTLAMLLALATTPLARRFALLVGAIDAPDPRRVHVRPTPRAGGVGVALAVVIAVAVAGSLPATIGPAVLAGALLLFIAGLADDVWSLPPRTKLLAQIGAALLAVAGGLRFTFCAWATSGAITGTEAHVLDALLTVMWVVFVTNALNLTDGLDGLASGIGVAGLVALAATAIGRGDAAAAVLPLAIAGALVGFLVYNFNPASIFLGDSGSLLIGYALAVLPLAGKEGELMGPLGAFLIVALPATDTLLAMTRRLLSRCLPAWGDGLFWTGLIDGLRNTFTPDRRHVHHRLLDLGFDQRRAVLLLYLAALVTGVLGYEVADSPIWPIDIVGLCVGLAVMGLVQALGIDELQIARTGLFLPVLHRLARHRWVVVGVDLIAIIGTYVAGNFLTGKPPTVTIFGPKLIIIATAHLAMFRIFGVYRAVWWSSGMSEFGVLFRGCAAGAIVSYLVLRSLDLATFGTVAVVRFFLLLPTMTLIRYSHVLLTNAARRGAVRDRALICGTAQEAQHALTLLRRSSTQSVEPIGFIEMQPRLQGRRLGRLPVVGTLDLLQSLVRERQVSHLVIADPALRGEALRWTRAVCRFTGVDVHRYVERLQPLANGGGHANGNGGGNGKAHVEIALVPDAVTVAAAPHAAANGNGVAAHTVAANGNGNGHANGTHTNGDGTQVNGNGQHTNGSHANGNGTHANGNGRATTNGPPTTRGARTNGGSHDPTA